MPPNGGRGCFEIVVLTDSDKEFELISGLRNAIEHGSTLKSAMQSFVNAGYAITEVSNAAKKINFTGTYDTMQKTNQQGGAMTQPLPSTSYPAQNKKSSKKLLIVIAIISVIVLAGAAVLGIFWNKLF